jgi:hypothetical protein
MSTTATFGSALASKVAVAWTAGTRVDWGLGLDVALCGPREDPLAAGLDIEADLVVGRGSEPVRDAVGSLGAAMEVRDLDGGCEMVGSCVPSAVMLLSVRMV